MSGPRTDAGKRLLQEYRDFVAEVRSAVGASVADDAVLTLSAAVKAVEIDALRGLRRELDRVIEMAEAEPAIDPRYRNTAGWVEGWIDGVKAIRDELAELDAPAAAT